MMTRKNSACLSKYLSKYLSDSLRNGLFAASVFSFGLLSLSFASCQMPAYQAEYGFQGAVTGEIHQDFSATAMGYKFQSLTQAHKYFFRESLNEQVVGQVMGQGLLPTRYLNKSNHIQIDFNRATHTITISHNHLKDFTLPISSDALNVQDTLSMPLQLQLMLLENPNQKAYPIQVVMLTQKQQAQISSLSFENLGVTSVKTALGDLKSIELETTYSLNQHQIQTQYWFAPGLHDVLIKSATSIDGKPIATASLKQYHPLDVCVVK